MKMTVISAHLATILCFYKWLNTSSKCHTVYNECQVTTGNYSLGNTQQKPDCWVLTQWSCVTLNMCELRCLVGKLSIVSHTTCPWQKELQDFVPQFSHRPSALLCHHFLFLSISLSLVDFLSIHCFSNLSFLPCFPAPFPTPSYLFSIPLTHHVFHIHTICLSLFFSLCIVLSVPLSAVGYVGQVAGQSSLISPPFFSLCGPYERSCNNQRSSVMTSDFPCLGWSSTRRRSVCVRFAFLFL